MLTHQKWSHFKIKQIKGECDFLFPHSLFTVSKLWSSYSKESFLILILLTDWAKHIAFKLQPLDCFLYLNSNLMTRIYYNYKSTSIHSRPGSKRKKQTATRNHGVRRDQYVSAGKTLLKISQTNPKRNPKGCQGQAGSNNGEQVYQRLGKAKNVKTRYR